MATLTFITMKTPKKTGKTLLFFYLSLLSLLALSACAQLVHFDTAQSSFSKGAELENRQLFAGNILDDSEKSFNVSRSVQQEMTDLTPEFYYARAYASIQDALKRKGALKKDGLLGNAMALKALCEWKLKKYGEARLTAQQAKIMFLTDSIPSVRDRAVMTALEGFIENDMVYNEIGRIEKQISQKLTETALSGVETAELYEDIEVFYKTYIRSDKNTSRLLNGLKIIQKAKDDAPFNHPIQPYLTMSQLVCMKNWSDAVNKTNELLKKIGLSDPESSARKWVTAEREIYEKERDEYLEQLAKELPGNTQDAAYVQWKKILN